jgi:hypothetical protein
VASGFVISRPAIPLVAAASSSSGADIYLVLVWRLLVYDAVVSANIEGSVKYE